MTYYTIGSKTISAALLITLISLIIGYIIVYITRKKDPERKIISDMIMNHFILFIVYWKISLIVIHPKLVLGNVMSLVYFTGGKIGFVLALLLSIITVIFQLRRKQISLESFQISTILFAVISFMSYGFITIMLVNFHIYSLLQGLLALLVLLLTFSKKSFSLRLAYMDGLLWYAVLMLLLSFIMPSNAQHAGFTYQQLLLFATAVYSLLLNKRFLSM